MTRGRVDLMNWRDEKRTLRDDYAAGRDEHFVQELTRYMSFLKVINVVHLMRMIIIAALKPNKDKTT